MQFNSSLPCHYNEKLWISDTAERALTKMCRNLKVTEFYFSKKRSVINPMKRKRNLFSKAILDHPTVQSFTNIQLLINLHVLDFEYMLCHVKVYKIIIIKNLSVKKAFSRLKYCNVFVSIFFYCGFIYSGDLKAFDFDVNLI